MKQLKDGTETARDNEKDCKNVSLSETWPQDAQNELEEFIEQQGIYIRQSGMCVVAVCMPLNPESFFRAVRNAFGENP